MPTITLDAIDLLTTPTVEVPLPLDVPPPPVRPGRLRTNDDWLTRQPDLYQEVRDRIIGGDTNVRALAAEYAPRRWNARLNKDGITEDAMRRSITAMISEDLGREKYDEIVQLKAAILRGEMVDKASEVGDKANSAKDLAAVGMVMKLAGDTLAGMGGTPQPVVRHEHLHVHTTPDALEHRRQEAIKRMKLP